VSRDFEVAIIGGGLVGCALACGLRSLGRRLVVLDEGEHGHCASRGNFGLIWVQGKGRGLAAYGAFTQASARMWPRLAAELLAETGIDVALRQPGGFHLCLTARELELRAANLAEMFAQPGFERYDIDVLDRAELAGRLPGLGAEVAGGTWCALDGDCNPLRLLFALRSALDRAHCRWVGDARVDAIQPRGGGFGVGTRHGVVEAERVVLAAGLGNARLAPMVDLTAPVAPNKGQILVLERMAPFLAHPVETIRQTDDGTVLVGDSQQDAGFDTAVDPAVLAVMARRAVAAFPRLHDARVVRAWAALRVMSPDGFPIYAQSPSHPGAFLATCHSGVTLAAAHVYAVAPALAAGALGDALAPFSPRRFDVRAAA
jgi:glycine/D-amino acid oxidase-like deaminating enzyme